MLKNPIAIIVFILSIELAVLYIANHRYGKRFFEFIPSIFWIYFCPMLASTLGIIDPQSPVYSKITTYLLPVSLFILLITVDIKAIARLGRPALLMFFIGSFGIVLGMGLVFWIFKPFIGGKFWSGFGALAGSWTGGSANMIAVKEALGTPDQVFLPMVVVDTIVPYVWMGIMVSMVGCQDAYDRWNKSDRRILDDLSRRMGSSSKIIPGKMCFLTTLGIVFIGIMGAGLAQFIAGFFPVIKGMFSLYAWVIIVVSVFGLVFSMTPLRKIEGHGSNKIGYFILYFVLASIGAKASLNNFSTALVLIAAGFLVVFIHAAILLVASRIMKIPLFLVAVASQANVGGVASTPVVAEIYQHGFACAGLLLAILGNIIGTYAGILTGGLCHILSLP